MGISAHVHLWDAFDDRDGVPLCLLSITRHAYRIPDFGQHPLGDLPSVILGPRFVELT